MHFGAPVWVFQWNPPYDDAVRRIARLGFQSVELIAWNREAIDQYYTKPKISELRTIIDGEGLRLSEFVSTMHDAASADVSTRNRSLDHFKNVVEVAVNLGTSIVNTVSATPFALRVPHLLTLPQLQQVIVDMPPPLRSTDAWRENYKSYVQLLRECCRVCEDAGVRYALEPHPYRYVTDAQSMLRLIEHVESPALGINYDPSHTFPSGDIPHIAVYQLGDRIFHTHLSDNDATTNAHWRPGRGKIDWKAFLVALNDVGYTGTLSIEMEDVPGVSHREKSGIASELFDNECKMAMAYLSGLASEASIPLGQGQ